RRQWKKILKSGKHLDRLDPQHRHKLRIQAKKLRYAAEFFAPAFPRKRAIRRRKDFVASLQQLQDALGELNDIAVSEKLLEQLGDGEDASGKRHGAASGRPSLAACRAAMRRGLRPYSSRGSELMPPSPKRSRSGCDPLARIYARCG